MSNSRYARGLTARALQMARRQRRFETFRAFNAANFPEDSNPGIAPRRSPVLFVPANSVPSGFVLTARPTDQTRRRRYPLYSLRNTEIPRVRDVAHGDGDGSRIGRFVKRISAVPLSLGRLVPFPRMSPRSLVSWTTGS